MDGLSVMKFAEEFVSCLDDVAKGTLNVEDEVNNDRSNMRQGVLTLLASYQPLHYRILQWLLPLSILQQLVLFCMRVSSRFDAKNPVTSKFSDAVRTCKTNNKLSRIRLIPRRLSSEKTERIIKLCRKNRCTVQGAMLACCHLAVASLVRDDKTHSVISFSWYCPVNVRSQCVPRISEDNFGHYTTFLMENVQVPEISARYPDEFWRFALQCTQVVHGGIRTGRHLQSLYILPFAHLVNPKQFVSEFLLHSKMNQPEFLSPVHSLTNLGKINWEAKPEAMFVIDDVFGGSGAFRHGPTFVNHIATFDGVMRWSTSYFTGNITEHAAHQFVTLVFDNLESILVAD